MNIHTKLFLPRTFICLGILILLAAVFFCSCAPGENSDNPPAGGDPPAENPPDDGPDEIEPPDYEGLGVNELGQVMILMYHEIGETEAEWCRTPENFRKDLESLYQKGYRLISLNDFIDGNIDTPAGTTPVVLTFDDGSGGQFRYLENSAMDPDCAVAMLEDFHRQHPDFGLAATFFTYYEYPFRQDEHIKSKYDYLVQKGFEIGNHTYTHENLRNLSPDEAKEQIARHVERTWDYLPGYQVRSLALPYGEYPDDMEHIIAGTWETTSYYNEAILLVGANPAPSPFSNSFNPSMLPRVRASEMLTAGVGMYEWLEMLDDQPGRRYVSDGDPETVAIPSALADQLREETVAEKKVVKY